jgi:hypothetical protein
LIDFLLDVNTEQAFHCNRLLFVAFVNGDIRIFVETGDRYAFCKRRIDC